MSIKVQRSVWEHSRHRGLGLLVLLAIADFADDNGEAYPSVRTLAKKVRSTERNVRKVLARLRESDDLEVMESAGPRGCNVYRLSINPAGLNGQPVSAGSLSDRETNPVSEANAHCPNRPGDPVPEDSQTIREPSPEPSTIHHRRQLGSRIKPTEGEQRARRPSYSKDFVSDFWELYPKKRGKAAAFREWKRLRPDHQTRSEIRNALGWQRESRDWTKENGRFVPDPERYLKNRRWEDEPLPDDRTIQGDRTSKGDPLLDFEKHRAYRRRLNQMEVN